MAIMCGRKEEKRMTTASGIRVQRRGDLFSSSERMRAMRFLQVRRQRWGMLEATVVQSPTSPSDHQPHHETQLAAATGCTYDRWNLSVRL